MAYEIRDNTGSLHANEKREKDTHPNAKGDARLICPHCNKSSDWWLDAWNKVAQTGKKWMSLSIKPKEKRAEQAAAPAEDGDSLPF